MCSVREVHNLERGFGYNQRYTAELHFGQSDPLARDTLARAQTSSLGCATKKT